MSKFYYRPDHPKASPNGFVEASELGEESSVSRVQISVDRHYENLMTQDGVLLNSRRQHQAYMKANNVTHMSDFKGVWAQAAKEREARASGGTPQERRERREDLGRALYNARKP